MNDACPCLVLAGDIGATKTDLGLFANSGTGPVLPVASTSFASRDANGIIARTRKFITREKARGRVVAGCFGVAGPVSRGRVRAVNLGLELDEESLAQALELPVVTLVNDLYATAFALARHEEKEVEVLQAGDPDIADGVSGVLAPGTGLGMALIQGTTIPGIVASEGGHCDFSPRNQDEVALWQWLRESFGHVSRERVLSGPGLGNIYGWLKGRSAATGRGSDAVLVLEAARKGEAQALRALDIFTAIMGAIAGDLALFGLAGSGIYLAGGMPPRILPYLRREVFLSAFCDKGRLSGWLKKVPVKLVLNPRTALSGAALVARSQLPGEGSGRR